MKVQGGQKVEILYPAKIADAPRGVLLKVFGGDGKRLNERSTPVHSVDKSIFGIFYPEKTILYQGYAIPVLKSQARILG